MRRTGLPGRVFGATPSIIAESERPVLAQGIQIGDVRDERAIIWSRADRPARLFVEWDLDERFRNPRARASVRTRSSRRDFTARIDLTQLPPGQRIFVRACFQSLDNDRALSEPVYRQLHAPRPNAVAT